MLQLREIFNFNQGRCVQILHRQTSWVPFRFIIRPIVWGNALMYKSIRIGFQFGEELEPQISAWFWVFMHCTFVPIHSSHFTTSPFPTTGAVSSVKQPVPWQTSTQTWIQRQQYAQTHTSTHTHMKYTCEMTCRLRDAEWDGDCRKGAISTTSFCSLIS